MNRRAAVTHVTARQSIAMLTGLALVTGGVVAAAAFVKPSKARAFDLFHGSIFLADDRAPVAVDLTNGNPTVRLLEAYSQVSAPSDTDLEVAPLAAGTLLVNRASGEFNMVDAAGFVVKTKGGGVPLPVVTGQTATQVVPSASSAYVVQNSPTTTGVYLVGQSTVEAARGSAAKVKPRASLTFESGSSGASESAISANGDLWLIAGAAKGHAVHVLSVPQGSSAGAALSDNQIADVPAVAAVGSAISHTVANAVSGSTDSDPRRVVAVATPDAITIYTPGSGSDYAQQKVATADTAKADRILPALGGNGSLTFLYHVPGATAGGVGGWQSVDVTADGKTVQPHRLGDIGDAALVQPVVSNGSLYTMDKATGTLWSIDVESGRAQHIGGLEQYPVASDASGKAQETNDFSDVYLTVRGSRVIVNSPNHRRAVVLFTDKSKAPVTIDKSAAVDLNASGGAAEIANEKAKKAEQAGPTPAATPEIAPPAPQINAAAQCATSSQIPHIPLLSSLTPASRSVLLAWAYPLLDSQDCAPSTYTVSIRLVGGNAPPPPATVTVQGQAGVNLVGLYPNTRYEVKVTAFINGKGTPSDPAQFTTGPEGPTAATGVHASADSSGNWSVSWNSCGAIANSCVPASQWTVIPTFCDGLGLSAPPASVIVSGDETLSQFSTVFGGSGSTLGRGISFEIQGVGADGTAGSTSGSSACLYSWSPPSRAAFQISASSPPVANFGQKTSATVTLTVAGDPNVAGGGVGYDYTFELLSGGSVLSGGVKTQDTVNVFDKIAVGQQYQARVRVTPPRHPEAAITLGPVDVDLANSAWPDMTLAGTPSVSNTDALTAKISLQIAHPTRAETNERFDVSGKVSCPGDTGPPQDVSASSVDPANFDLTGVNRYYHHESNPGHPCTLSNVRLLQTTGSFFGPSPQYSPALADIPVKLDEPAWTGSAGDFNAAFDATAANVTVTYTVAGSLAYQFYSNFVLTVRNCGATPMATCTQAGSTTCGLKPFGNSAATYTVPVTGTGSCQDPYGGYAGHPGNWVVELSYDFFGPHSFDLTQHNAILVTGTPPTAPPPTPTPSPSPISTP